MNLDSTSTASSYVPAPPTSLSTLVCDVTLSSLSDAAFVSAPLSPVNTSDTTASTVQESHLPGGSIVSDGPVYAVGGHNLPGFKKKFLDIETVLHELTLVTKPLEFVPCGVKEDQYFLVDNSDNMNRREKGKHGQYWDDCGAWESNSRGQKTIFVANPGQSLRKVVKHDGNFFLERQKNKKITVFISLDPQPESDSLLMIQCYYHKHTLSPTYRKHVTWITNKDNMPQVACVE